MGQIADDIIEGCCCMICCQYFCDPRTEEVFCHGYPVICWECWSEMSNKERTDYIRSLVDVFQGLLGLRYNLEVNGGQSNGQNHNEVK